MLRLKDSWFDDTPHQLSAQAKELTEENQAIRFEGFSTCGSQQQKQTRKEANNIRPECDIGTSLIFEGAAMRPLSLPKGEGTRSLLVKEQKTKTVRPRGESKLA